MNAVDPLFEPQAQFVGKTVSEQILKYWKANEVDRFTYSRPLKKTDDITVSPFCGLLISKTNASRAA